MEIFDNLTFEQLSNLSPEMRQIAFNAAFIKASKEFPSIVRGSKNPFYDSKYANLDTILSAVLPPLLANNLYVSQPIFQEAGTTYLITRIVHIFGGYIESPAYPLGSFNIPEGLFDFAKQNGESLKIESLQKTLDKYLDPQLLTKRATYARRYSLSALLSLSTDPDDDGNAASGKKSFPFSNPLEAINWASKELNISSEEAQKLFEECPLDDQGYKSKNFLEMVLQLKK